jgi:hypothetical protein
MTELRLTFASEGFAAVSQVLVDMGLSFRVEPVGETARKEAAPAVEAAPAAKGRTPAKPARKSAAKAKRPVRSEKAPADEATLAGAERLRAAVARSGTAYRSPLEPPKRCPARGPSSSRPSGGGEDGGTSAFSTRWSHSDGRFCDRIEPADGDYPGRQARQRR